MKEAKEVGNKRRPRQVNEEMRRGRLRFFFHTGKEDRDRATWFGLNPVVTAPTSQLRPALDGNGNKNGAA